MKSLSYDDTVVLGTLLVILRSNQTAYDTHFVTQNGTDTNLKILQNSADSKNFFDPNAKNIFGFVKEVLLKESENPPNSSSITPEIELEIVNNENAGIKIQFDNKATLGATTGTFDKDATKSNFEKNFINLAQVFYECGFGTTVQKAVLTNQINSGLSAEIADLAFINSDIGFCKTILKNLKNKTTLHVLYCNGATVRQRYNEKDFTNLPNVKFTTNKIPGRCISSIKDYVKKNKSATHTIVFLDGISFLNTTEISDLNGVFSDKFVDIIIYDSQLDRKDIQTTDLSSSPDNVKFTLIKKEDLGTTSQPSVKTSMFRGTEIVEYEFTADVDGKVVKIGKDPDDSKVKEILDYYLFSKIVVHITTN